MAELPQSRPPTQIQPSGLDAWLSLVLPAFSSARSLIEDEVRTRFNMDVRNLTTVGHGEPQAYAKAIHNLGAPDAAKRQFVQIYITLKEEQNLGPNEQVRALIGSMYAIIALIIFIVANLTGKLATDVSPMFVSLCFVWLLLSPFYRFFLSGRYNERYYSYKSTVYFLIIRNLLGTGLVFYIAAGLLGNSSVPHHYLIIGSVLLISSAAARIFQYVNLLQKLKTTFR